jgi:hypothetical protein
MMLGEKLLLEDSFDLFNGQLRQRSKGVSPEPLLFCSSSHEELGDGWTLASGSSSRQFSDRCVWQSARSFLLQRVRLSSLGGRKTNQTFCFRHAKAVFVFHLEDTEA